MTSHDVVARVRRILGERRVGHAGTLDPDASGVLVVGVGQATRLLGLLTLDRKAYRASFALGTETSTDDAAGEITRTATVSSELLDERFARAVVADLVGETMQVPPTYSAISVEGKRAYALAREGKKPELTARPVRIYAAELVSLDATLGTWTVDLDVSKGTYVRAIARDLGRSLGSAMHVASLTRTASGPITLASCVSLERLEELGAAGLMDCALNPCTALCLPTRVLDDATAADASVGRRIPAEADDTRVCLVYKDKLVGVWERHGGWLTCLANFPEGIGGVHS